MLLPAALGVLATLVGMAAGHLVAALLNPAASPVLAVGSTVIDLTPTPVKEWAIAQFGTADKPILIGSVLLGTLLLAGVAGVLAQRSFILGASLLLALVGLAGAAALARPAATVADALPAIAAAAAGLGSLALLTGGVVSRQVIATAADGDDQRDRTSAVVPSCSSARPPSRWARPASGSAPCAAGSATSSCRPRRTAAGRFPQGLETEYDGISALRTPTDDFYRVDTRLTVPTVGVDDWTLTIDGDVENELTFTFDELAAMPLIERDITLNCVSNAVGGPYISSARWLGVRLTDLLDQAGVGSGADQILSTDVDGFTISTPLEVATDGRDAMVVIGMNGGPLPRERGFPARLLVPGLYGFVGATKWLTRLTLTTYDAEQAYWTERDWAVDAPVKIASRVDTPKALASLDAGRVVIGGVAWAQRRGIGKVEVRIDDGEWRAPSSARRSPSTTGASGTSPGTPPPAATTSPSEPPPRTARCRPRSAPPPSPTAPPAGSRSPSSSAESRGSQVSRSPGIPRLSAEVLGRHAGLPGHRVNRQGPTRTNLLRIRPIRTYAGAEPLRERSTHPPVGAPESVPDPKGHDHEAHHPAPLGRPCRAGPDRLDEPHRVRLGRRRRRRRGHHLRDLGSHGRGDQRGADGGGVRPWARRPRRPDLRRRLRRGARRRRRLVRRDGHRARRQRGERQPAALDAGRRGHRRRPGRHAQLAPTAITVFAPANPAFDAFSKKQLNGLLKDKETLTAVLTHHVVAGQLSPDDLAGEHETLNGDMVTVEGSGEDFTVGEEGATVLCGNVPTANATVYIIDTVLMPS